MVACGFGRFVVNLLIYLYIRYSSVHFPPPSPLQERIVQLEQLLEDTDSSYDQEKIQEWPTTRAWEVCDR